MNCFEVSKKWIDDFSKCCPGKKLLWDKTTKDELSTKSLKKTSLASLQNRFETSHIVEQFDAEEDFSDQDYETYIDFLEQINDIDNSLKPKELTSAPINLLEWSTNGKKSLSDTDKLLVAVALTKATGHPSTMLATDDNRILKIIEKSFTSLKYCCSPKLIFHFKNLKTFQELKDICSRHKIYIYSGRHHGTPKKVC